MSRDVEVLRDMVAWEQSRCWPKWQERIAVLSAAISALEEKEASREGDQKVPDFVCLTWDAGVVCGNTRPCPKHESAAPPKSSSDSMEKRIRTLESLLARAEAFIRTETTPGPVSLLAEIQETLHPHQPWCRGDHSEGACVPQENPEP